MSEYLDHWGQPVSVGDLVSYVTVRSGSRFFKEGVVDAFEGDKARLVRVESEVVWRILSEEEKLLPWGRMPRTDRIVRLTIDWRPEAIFRAPEGAR